jgi:valyl-tRNA synthetase
MEPVYQAQKYETEIYQLWQGSGFFNPDNLRKLTRNKAKLTKTFTIVIPPPNITGSLHLGHALNGTIQDILIRFHRMNGYQTLWLPGTDHAGIATQNVVEKELKKEGLTRHQLGRERFLERVWQWVEKYGNLIIEQFKKLGFSCDWSRQRFTLDKDYIKAVETAFLHYYKKGLIYRGPRIVNWCPRCETAISDIEVKYQETTGKLYYIKYKIKNKENYVVVATTRPETMLGDTAVAVNPKDKRYKDLIGQKVILPLINREIPIIAHHLVDQRFGTGAVKITPAHDTIDWQIGKEKKLAIINVIGPDGKMTEGAGDYAGLPVLEARKKIIENLKALNLLEKEEDYTHNLALCDRCQTPIEPQVSTQWFLKMKDLARPAIEVVKKGKIKITPRRYKKIYLNWLAKVEDWCISRQLWWGHKIPLKRENDVLDTWFSSALWPFAAFGWPKKTRDLKKFYPTDFLSTAQEILYLWVARMVFSSLEFTKKIPFKNIYIHPTVLAISGKRMSKSLGTGVDTLEITEKYGADAVRMGLIYQITREQQAFKFDERTILSARNFVNKLWNISRFVQIKIKDLNFQTSSLKAKTKPITLADKWILSRLNTIIELTTKKIKNYQFGEAIRELYDFVWHEFADWYLEIAKLQILNLKTQKSTALILYNSLLIILKLLHPFTPFVTETVFQEIINQKLKRGNKKLLMIADWPRTDKKLINKKAEKDFEKIKNFIIEIRNWRQKQKIQPKEIVDYKIKKSEKIFSENKEVIEKLTNARLIF